MIDERQAVVFMAGLFAVIGALALILPEAAAIVAFIHTGIFLLTLTGDE